MTTLRTASVVDSTKALLALLSALGEDMNVSGALLEAPHHLHHVGARVFVGPVHAAQLQVSPVDVAAVHRECEGVDRGGDQQLNKITVSLSLKKVFFLNMYANK